LQVASQLRLEANETQAHLAAIQQQAHDALAELRQTVQHVLEEGQRHLAQLRIHSSGIQQEFEETGRQAREVKQQFQQSGQEIVDYVARQLPEIRQQAEQTQRELATIRQDYAAVGQEIGTFREQVRGLEPQLSEARQEGNQVHDRLSALRESVAEAGLYVRQVTQEMAAHRNELWRVRTEIEALGREVKDQRTTMVEVSQEETEGPKRLGIVVEMEKPVVAEVEPLTPAEKAGLQAGDVITRVNETPVASGEELRAVIDQAPVGEEITLEVARGDERKSVKAHLDAPASAEVVPQ